jgi:hypothetical protein
MSRVAQHNAQDTGDICNGRLSNESDYLSSSAVVLSRGPCGTTVRRDRSRGALECGQMIVLMVPDPVAV